jgi:5,10-methylenetetrahydromethanopterin reductase
MTRMAAKYADGVLYNGSHPRDIAWASDRVEEGLDDRPDHRGDFEFVAYASVSVAEDASAAREAARPPVAFIAGSAPDPVLDRHGIDHDRASEVGETIAAGEFTQAFDLVTEDMLSAFCIAGTPDTVENRIAAILEDADGIVIGSPLGPDLATAIDLAGDAVRRTMG